MKSPHQPEKWKSIPWLVCRCCGLVYLRNDRTAKTIKDGCDK